MSDLGNEEDWELINDCGFVYKRKKRPRVSSAPPSSEPAVEERNLRERKKRSLLKLKKRYLKEIHNWEHLQNTLHLHQSQSQIQPHPQPQIQQHQPSSIVPDSAILDDLLAQAEAHEAVIRHALYLCDVAESLSEAQEECVTQSLIDLPIWRASPHQLISSLCDD